MKRYGLLLVLCLFSCASSNGSSIESSLSISSEIDYGTVSFENVFVYGDGYDQVKIRPYFSNPEVSSLVSFTYEVADENICSVEEGIIYYVGEGQTTITAHSNFYEDKTFYVVTKDYFSFSGQAQKMENSVLTSYQEGDTLFLGDSFFEFWRNGVNTTKFYDVFADYKVFNIGISATTTHDWRVMAQRVIANTSPKNIVVNIGINNVDDDGESGLKCFRNIRAMIEDYLEMFEDVNVYYMSITRCTGVFASKWKDHELSNTFMKKYCQENERVHYLDVMEVYGNEYASYLSDGLHPNQKGYDVFESLIKDNVPLEEK